MAEKHRVLLSQNTMRNNQTSFSLASRYDKNGREIMTVNEKSYNCMWAPLPSYP